MVKIEPREVSVIHDNKRQTFEQAHKVSRLSSERRIQEWYIQIDKKKVSMIYTGTKDSGST
jgi:hypothetical protein